MLSKLLVLNFVLVAFSSDLKSIQNDHFGSHLLQTIALRSRTPQSDINELLDSISNKLLEEQRKDDYLNKTRSYDCFFESDFLDRPIELMESEIKRSEAIVAEKEPIYYTVQSELEDIQQEINSLNTQNKKLETSKETSKESSIQDYQSILNTLQNHLDYLHSIQETQTSQNIHDVSQTMDPLPPNLLQADQDSVNKVADIMQELHSYYYQTINLQKQYMSQAKAQSGEVNLEIGIVVSNLKAVTEELEIQKMQLLDDIEGAKRMIAEASEELRSMVAAKDAKTLQCSVWTKQYFKDSNRRSKEIGIVEAIKELWSQDSKSFLEKLQTNVY